MITLRTKEIIKKLKELYAWDRYVYNCIKHNTHTIPLTRKRIIANPPNLWTAFYWVDAEEPSSYWSRIFTEMADYWDPVYPEDDFKI